MPCSQRGVLKTRSFPAQNNETNPKHLSQDHAMDRIEDKAIMNFSFSSFIKKKHQKRVETQPQYFY